MEEREKRQTRGAAGNQSVDIELTADMQVADDEPIIELTDVVEEPPAPQQGQQPADDQGLIELTEVVEQDEPVIELTDVLDEPQQQQIIELTEIAEEEKPEIEGETAQDETIIELTEAVEDEPSPADATAEDDQPVIELTEAADVPEEPVAEQETIALDELDDLLAEEADGTGQHEPEGAVPDAGLQPSAQQPAAGTSGEPDAEQEQPSLELTDTDLDDVLSQPEGNVEEPEAEAQVESSTGELALEDESLELTDTDLDDLVEEEPEEAADAGSEPFEEPELELALEPEAEPTSEQGQAGEDQAHVIEFAEKRPEAAEVQEQAEPQGVKIGVEHDLEQQPDDEDEIAPAIGLDLEEAEEPPAPPAEAIDDQRLEKAIEQVIEKRFGARIEQLVIDTIERAVRAEIQRIKQALLDEDDLAD